MRLPRLLIHLLIVASIAVGTWGGVQLFWVLATG